MDESPHETEAMMVLALTGGSGRSVRSDEFTWNGRRLVYETYGDSDRLLVLLHGLLMDTRLYRDVARALAAR
ncbi:MAG TPA: hypothetical protein VF015_11915, partial [Acidimicrobiales bacterium]